MQRDERDALIEAHVGLVPRLVRRRFPMRYSVFGVNFDDLCGAGYLALVEAAESYQPERGIPFRHWANVKVHVAIQDVFRSLHGRQDRGQARDFIGGDGVPERGVRMLIEDAIEQREQASLVRACLPALSGRRRSVVRGVLANQDRHEVCAALGITTYCYQEARSAAVHGIRKALASRCVAT